MRITSQTIVSGILALLILGVVFMPLQADAAGLVPCGGEGEPACGLCHIFQLGHNIITFFLLPSESINNNIPVVPLLASLLFAVGGIYLLSGAGNPQLYEKGRKTLTSVVIGLLIVYAAWVFVNTLLMFLGVASWTGLGSWWQIQCGI